MLEKHRIIYNVVIGHYDYCISSSNLSNGQRNRGQFPLKMPGAENRDIWIVITHTCQSAIKKLDDCQRWGFASVVNILLVGSANEQDLRPLKSSTLEVETLC